jgi:hypothetical protein
MYANSYLNTTYFCLKVFLIKYFLGHIFVLCLEKHDALNPSLCPVKALIIVYDNILPYRSLIHVFKISTVNFRLRHRMHIYLTFMHTATFVTLIIVSAIATENISHMHLPYTHRI